MLLVLLIIVAGGVGALLLLKNKDKGAKRPPETQSSCRRQPRSSICPSRRPSCRSIRSTVNLRRDEGDHYLQAVIVLRVSDPKLGESLKGFMPEIRHRINLLLSSKLPSELSTTEGREYLAASIVDEANTALGFPVQTDARGRTASNGPIQAVLFNSFIIQ
ncbi:flagellar basal body-associated FliL family protein [Thauera humireducens]|uniref:flagellar basal body-associated FliL family protein n=1 Tax=Thauera humireducens TaxID=1134435 RepID=UPI00311F07E4